jgi:hypothetical protein
MPSCAPQTYKENSTVKDLDSSYEIKFEFTGLEPATGEVVITYFHKGDNSEFGTYDLKADMFSLGNSLTGELTACSVYVESPTREPVTADDFNDIYMMGGVLKVSMVFDDFMNTDNTCTDDQMAYVSLQYQYAGCGGIQV